MRIPAVFYGGLVLGPLLFSAQPLRPQTNGCALLNSADLTVLLGGAAIAKPNAGACSWVAAGSARRLLAVGMRARGPSPEMSFTNARNAAAARNGAGTVTDEAGLGDKAFASLQSFGVVMIMLKQGRMLQLQYVTGGAGTAKDLALLRPVARKAIAMY